MSAQSGATAIVSLGMSCQSSRQIRTHVETFSSILGEEFEPERHFFDGLISPISGLADLFDDGFQLFTRDAIQPGPGFPTWEPYGIRFLHHFRETDSSPEIDRFFEREKSKFSHLREKFVGLSEAERLIFVISNSQNNLSDVALESRMPCIEFKQSQLERLMKAVDTFLDKRCEYLVVSHPERHGGLPDEAIHIMKADETEWTGDKTQWRALFQSYLSDASDSYFCKANVR
ncbi:conserved hypothetical protein [Roseibium sp. TrichSKD4]|uniref:hypothetical protein n=1 Tax=Roseibium sp. TrichSKD4 TaxID=744980 RepID=UPI0001E56305|nr:hypothetical protein [Roseibium sp. TrichSKD4]EFO34556.1 conserved hypothetical protein [Roseibium sp. TrichSKD4]